MKTRAILASTALILSSFVPVLNTTAWAAVTILDPLPDAEGASAATLTAMEAQCDALALVHGFNWHGELDPTSIVATIVGSPVEVPPLHTIDDAIGDPIGSGIFTPAHIEFTSDPYRNGGSVNMWANANAVGGHYSASIYDFEHDFDTTFSYAFDCLMSETVTTGASGFYELAGEFGDSNDAIRANCDAFTALGDNDPRPKWWGEPFHGGSLANPHCRFVGDPGSTDDEDRDPENGTPIEQTQRDTLLAHEDNGEGFDITETVSIGKVLVCISPTTSTQTKKGAPGTWVAMHGYSGLKCTTLWYNTGATVGVSNLNTGSNNVVTVPIDLP